MIGAVSQILASALFGEIIVFALGVPIPGSAAGMAVLACNMVLFRGQNRDIEAVFDSITPYFPLFFVPSAVGFVDRLELLRVNGVTFVIAVVFGTVAAVAIAGLTFQAVLNLHRQRNLA